LLKDYGGNEGGEVVKKKEKVPNVMESLEFLKKYRIPLAEYVIAKDVDGALEAAKKIGYPVVLKVISEKAVHKTDVGGIIVDIDSDKEMQAAFDKIKRNMKKIKADFGGVVVQKMIGSGAVAKAQEVIVGGKLDPSFGQTVAFGLGGLFVEVFDDITFRVVPLKEKDAENMIKDIKGYKVLMGARGKKYDIQAISDIIMKTSKMLEENKNIAELDINPVMVLPKGAFAVDARIVIEYK
jgi:acyl-CoA synthetase (NDP forming)